MNDLRSEYLNWIMNLVDIHDEEFITKLDSVKFWYDRPFDENRLQDGIDLRYRFAADCYIPSEIIETEFIGKFCSFLEVAAALSLRLEESIMFSPEAGDRTGKWFREILDGLYIKPEDTPDMIRWAVDLMIEGQLAIFEDSDPSDEIWVQAVKHLNNCYHVPLIE